MLDYLEKVALRGEISKIMLLYSRHDEDIPYGCFMALSMYYIDFYNDMVSILKELVDVDIVKRVCMYYQSRVIPYEIYADKMLADLEDCLTEGDVASVNMTRSVFCNYIKRLEKVSLVASHMILNKVLQDERFEDLQEDAFYLKSNMPVPVETKISDEHPTEQEALQKYNEDCAIFKVSVMSTDMLSFDEVVNGVPEEQEEQVQKTTYDEIREKFADAEEGSYFVVNKVKADTDESVSTRSFVSIDDVITYLQSIDIEELSSDVYRYVISEVILPDD